MSPEIEETVKRIETERGFVFEEADIQFAESQSKKKIESADKEADYFPLIFRNELEDIVMRYEINAISRVS